MVRPKVVSSPDAVIPARLHPSGFQQSDSNFYSLSAASDGRLYYTLCSHKLDSPGRGYRYDPATDKVEMVCDLGEACGEAGQKFLPQGKSHSPYYELDGKLYFATHYGYFATVQEREQPAPVPEGYKPYPGGHILAYDLATGQVEDLAKAPAEQGIITFNMDAKRGRLYGLTWPTGLFLVYDIEKRELRNLGPVYRGGEGGKGDQYFCLVRALAVDPRDGSVYFTTPDGVIQRYNLDADRIEPFPPVSMRRDLFGQWDPAKAGHQGYNWRCIHWHEPTQTFFGVHSRSGWLFQFEPRAQRLELIDRICADSLRRGGYFEPYRYGYLTLQFSPDLQTIYYLTSTYGVLADDGKTVLEATSRVSPEARAHYEVERQTVKLEGNRRVFETTHAITYHIASRQYADHGMLLLDDGRHVRMCHSHVVHPTGRCYSVPWIDKPNRAPDDRAAWQCDLISYPDPLAKKKKK